MYFYKTRLKRKASIVFQIICSCKQYFLKVPVETAASKLAISNPSRVVVYRHHNYNDISMQRYVYKFKYREIHNTLTDKNVY